MLDAIDSGTPAPSWRGSVAGLLVPHDDPFRLAGDPQRGRSPETYARLRSSAHHSTSGLDSPGPGAIGRLGGVSTDGHAAAGGPVVTATDLTRRFGEGETAVDALRGVSLDVSAGELVAVMGPSGLGQVDADAHPRRARQADVGHASRSPARTSARSATPT